MSRKLLTTPAVTGTPSTQKTYIHIEERTTFRTLGPWVLVEWRVPEKNGR